MRIWSKYRLIIFFLICYAVLRILLINVNVTEWGDSFRILRAAEYILNFSYPLDEKRLPFFSALLSPGLLFLEPVLWGRIYAILATLTNLILTAVLFKQIFPKAKQTHLLTVMTLLAFNPIFFYWSLRIMAETTFTVLVLLTLIVHYGRSTLRPYLIGFFLVLASLTRYEGFLLAGAFGLSYLVKKDWRSLVKTFSVWVILVAPWFILTKVIFKGGTSDAYVSELSTFNFDLYRLGYFLTYSLFFIGSPVLTALAITNYKLQIQNFISSPIAALVILEFGLFFIWTPSLPRIMLPIIPLATILVVKNLIEIDLVKQRRMLLMLSVVSTMLFLLLQFKFKLYFLVLSYFGLGIILALSLLAMVAIWLGSKRLFLASVLATFFVGSFVVVTNQRLVYSTIYKASIYAKELSGKVAYSDETGVSAWYLGSGGAAYPQNLQQDVSQQQEWLLTNQVTDVLDSNEFNRGSRLDVSRMQCNPKFEETIADKLDQVLIQLKLMKPRSYTKIYSQICHV